MNEIISASVMGLRGPAGQDGSDGALAPATHDDLDAGTATDKAVTPEGLAYLALDGTLAGRLGDVEAGLSEWVAQQATLVTGHYIRAADGVSVANASYQYIKVPLTGDELAVRATAHVQATSIALAVYYDAADAYLGYETLGSVGRPVDTGAPLHPPAAARSAAVTSYNDTLPALEVLTLAADVGARLQAVEGQAQAASDFADEAAPALSAWAEPDYAIVDGYYVNSSGVPTALAGFCYVELDDIAPGQDWTVSARVNGSGMALARYVNSGGAVISSQGVGSSSVVDYTDEPLVIPAGTVKAYIGGRDNGGIGTIILKKKQLVGDLAQRVIDGSASGWASKKVAMLGDSLTANNVWPPMVVDDLRIAVVNCGVGGSKFAKPDSAPSQVSMCDDARIAALPADAAAVTIQGGTNDWAQSIPLGSIVDPAASADDADNTTFYGALHQILVKARAQCPAALLVLVATEYAAFDGTWASRGWADAQHNLLGLTTQAYADAIVNVGAVWNLPVARWDQNGVNPVTAPLMLLNQSGDHIHHTPLGGRAAANSVTAVLKAHPAGA